MIQLYGRFDGFWSHPQVSRGITYALAKANLDLQIYNVHRFGGYEGLSEPVEEGGYDVSVQAGWNSLAPVGFYVGGYPPMAREWLTDHPFKAALFICESEIIPSYWGAIAQQLDLVVVPSRWCAEAYRKAGVDPAKLLVVHHGIHAVYRNQRSMKRLQPSTFLHIAGSRDFLDRKGTPQLVAAWAHAPEEWKLVIRTPPGPHIEALVRASPVQDRIFVDESIEALPPHEMLEYQLRGWAGIIQPSRAEAFGIVPLEARALGIPLYLTDCAGHVEHVHDTDNCIDYGTPARIKTNGIPNGLAPTVDADDIGAALWDTWAPGTGTASPADYARAWQWPVVCEKLVDRLRQAAKANKRAKTLDEKLLG